jgi:hypothetical protein
MKWKSVLSGGFRMRRSLIIPLCLVLASCAGEGNNSKADPVSDFEMELVKTYQGKPAGTSRAYALHKQTVGGPAWLATIHGYPDNKTVCEQLIEPYNSGEMPSDLPGTYFCEELSSI